MGLHPTGVAQERSSPIVTDSDHLRESRLVFYQEDIDKAAKESIIHKNTAARKKGQLTKSVGSL